MSQSDIFLARTKIKVSIERINFFQKHYGDAHLHFAYHAAFPLALTPDLLYGLWANFQRDIDGNLLNIPWIAITDLLFSNLCEEVGHELYEMEKTIRDVLLKQLKTNPRFGVKRINELSEFLLFDVQPQLDSSDIDIRDLAQAQRCAALVYTQTESAARELALILAELYKSQLENTAEWARMTSLIETFSEPLQEANLKPLLVYVRGMYHFVRGELETAALIFDELPGQEQQIEVAGVSLSIPIQIQRRRSPALLLEVFEFEFNVAQIRRKPKQWTFDSEWTVISSSSQAECFGEDWGEGVVLEMVSIPGGTFRMGSPDGEGNESEHPQYSVTIAPFFMSKYPVTQTQWRVVAGLPKVKIDLNPDPAFFKGPHRPVENVSWYDAVEFCERLQQKTGKFYRLPTEAEWEYACRAGTTTPFHFGETITPKLACYNGKERYAFGPKGKSRKETTEVGFFNVANAFGIYDMHGNVGEWCADRWRENYNIITGAMERVVRSGSWHEIPFDCRSASRGRDNPDNSSNEIGFRVAFSLGRAF